MECGAQATEGVTVKSRYLVLGVGALLAVALAVPALGGESGSGANASGVKQKAGKALKKAKKAQQAATEAAEAANGAQSSATQALGRSAKLSFLANSGTGTTTMFEGGGLRLEASCGPGVDVTANARSLTTGAVIHVATIGAVGDAHYGENESFDQDEVQTLTPGGVDDNVQATFTFRNPSGDRVVTGTYLLEELYGGGDCAVYGTVSVL